MNYIFGILLFALLICNSGCLPNDTKKYIEDLSSENIMVIREAVYMLGKNRKSEAVPVLIELLNKGQPKECSLSIIEALGEIGEGSSVDALIGVLGEKDNEMRIATIEALGRVKDPGAVKPLMDILNGENNREIRLTAVWALGNIEDRSASTALTLLLNDQDNYVRYNAAQALKKIGSGK